MSNAIKCKSEAKQTNINYRKERGDISKNVIAYPSFFCQIHLPFSANENFLPKSYCLFIFIIVWWRHKAVICLSLCIIRYKLSIIQYDRIKRFLKRQPFSYLLSINVRKFCSSSVPSLETSLEVVDIFCQSKQRF